MKRKLIIYANIILLLSVLICDKAFTNDIKSNDTYPIDPNHNYGNFYILKIPPGESIEVLIPSLCLDYQKSIPAKTILFQNTMDNPPALVLEIIKVHNHMERNFQIYYSQLKDQFNLDLIGNNMEKIKSLDKQVAAIRARIENGNSSRLSALKELLDVLKKYAEINNNTSPENIKPLSEKEKMDLFKELIDRSLQWAVWRRDIKFNNDWNNYKDNVEETKKALAIISYLIYETALRNSESNYDFLNDLTMDSIFMENTTL